MGVIISIGNTEEVFGALCAARSMFGVVVSHHWSNLEPDQLAGLDVFSELHKAVPWLPEGAEVQLYGGSYHLLFESQEDAEQAFGQVVGDDGPTEGNPYDGPVRVFAAMYGPDGTYWNDNT